MEAVLERSKSCLFDHKLSDEELAEVLANWDYDPSYYDDEDDCDVPAPVRDRFGNPTRETLDAMYETEHGLTEPTAVEDLLSWVDSL